MAYKRGSSLRLPVMELFRHQKEYLQNRNRDKDLLAHEGGTGKTIIGVEWLRTRDTTNALVICPKRVVQKWKDALGDVLSHVLSREDFKKSDFLKPTALIVDEADEWA